MNGFNLDIGWIVVFYIKMDIMVMFIYFSKFL